MTRPDQIRALAIALYGERWQRRTADALGVDPKQVRRWYRHTANPTEDHLAMMRSVVANKIEQLQRGLQLNYLS